MSRYAKYAPVVLRIGLSLVFMWFGVNQLMNTANWIGLVPSWVAQIFGGNAAIVVLLNGWFEVLASILLILGFQTRIVSLLLFLHLLGIAAKFGFAPTGIRDFGLAVATLAIFLNGYDIFSLDRRFLDKPVPQVQ